MNESNADCEHKVGNSTTTEVSKIYTMAPRRPRAAYEHIGEVKNVPSQADINSGDNLFHTEDDEYISTWWVAPLRRPSSSFASSNSPRNYWISLLLGQFIALTAASMNAASYTLVSRYNVQTQMFQMFFLYILLTLFLFRRRAIASAEDSYSIPAIHGSRLRAPWWIYLCCSLLDVFPNFMTLLSFKYTSLTSATLLGTLTVPSTMFFSRYLLGRKFRRFQYLGVCLCIGGGILTMVSDSLADKQERQSYIGDLLAIGAAMCYGLGDTVAEYFIKHVEREEYLGMLGLFGMLFTGILCPILEWNEMQALFQQLHETYVWIVATFTWYILSVYLYYTTESIFLVSSDATLLNLSLQACNLWAVLFSVALDRQLPLPKFFLAAFLVVCGVFVYEVVQKMDDTHRLIALTQDEPLEEDDAATTDLEVEAFNIDQTNDDDKFQD